MRQGPNYSQWVDRGPDERVYLRLPLEIEHDWEGFTFVVWTDNGDETYTLTPKKDL